MEFRLVYEGPLKANGRAAHKHEIRKILHPQLKELWEHPPLSDVLYYLNEKGTTGRFPELVTQVARSSSPRSSTRRSASSLRLRS